MGRASQVTNMDGKQVPKSRTEESLRGVIQGKLDRP